MRAADRARRIAGATWKRLSEVGYYIFDYPPQSELIVRETVTILQNKYNGNDNSLKIIVFDLYEIVIGILKQKNYLEKCFDLEKTKGADYTFVLFMMKIPILGKLSAR